MPTCTWRQMACAGSSPARDLGGEVGWADSLTTEPESTLNDALPFHSYEAVAQVACGDELASFEREDASGLPVVATADDKGQLLVFHFKCDQPGHKQTRAAGRRPFAKLLSSCRIDFRNLVASDSK